MPENGYLGGTRSKKRPKVSPRLKSGKHGMIGREAPGGKRRSRALSS